MEGRKYQLEIRGEKKSYPAATTYMAIAKEYQQFYEDDIVLVLVNNRLRELKRTLDTDGVMEFVTTADKAGKKAYRRSVSLLMQKVCITSMERTALPCAFCILSGRGITVSFAAVWR